jgi:hypothetical protein
MVIAGARLSTMAGRCFWITASAESAADCTRVTLLVSCKLYGSVEGVEVLDDRRLGYQSVFWQLGEPKVEKGVYCAASKWSVADARFTITIPARSVVANCTMANV